HFLLLIVISGVLLSACESETETLNMETIADYAPLSVGKYITYRLDSLVYTNFGRNVETHSYLVRHEVDAEITNGLGRPAYRVFRYLNTNLTGAGDWTANGSYLITSLTDQLEVTEDNLRMIKLHRPFRPGFTWKGNAYL